MGEFAPVPGPRVECFQLFPREIPHESFAAGGALDGRVVHHDESSIQRELHVELNPIGPPADPFLEGRQGILRRIPHGAAVADDQAGGLMGPERHRGQD